MVLHILIVSVFSIGSVSGTKCDFSSRGPIQWYFDPTEWTCFAYPADCESSLKVDFKLYDTEEECTLKNMVRMWKTYSLSCPPYKRMAVYKRSNGDLMPYLFSSALCNADKKSALCNYDETCQSFKGFAYCCKSSAFTGEGPTRGTFNFTGMGGLSIFKHTKSVTESPVSEPNDCNKDGDRQEIEWYPTNKTICLSRRKHCSTPMKYEENIQKTYKTQQECIDAHYANWKFSYRLYCMPGFSAVKADAALLFSKDKCGPKLQSDVCNRDEYCAYNNNSSFAFCCKKSSNPYKIAYTVYGKNYRHRFVRQTKHISI